MFCLHLPSRFLYQVAATSTLGKKTTPSACPRRGSTMKRHQDNSILPSSSPAPDLRRASELELAPCLQPPTAWLNGCRGFYGPVPRPLLMSCSRKPFREREELYQRTKGCQRLRF